MPDIATDTLLSHDEVISKIRTLLEHHGSGLYGGEVVTQTEHALQCAGLAELAGANAKLITASLLHEISHLLEPEFGSATAQSKDFCHEALGDKFLKSWFDADVTEPVRLHVAAKRYLCATDPDYQKGLSPASVKSMELQGGPMKPEEVSEFEQNPHYREAVILRQWDDLAKSKTAKTESVQYYMKFVKESLIDARK